MVSELFKVPNLGCLGNFEVVSGFDMPSPLPGHSHYYLDDLLTIFTCTYSPTNYRTCARLIHNSWRNTH